MRYPEVYDDMDVGEICAPGDTDRADSLSFMRFKIV